MNAAEQIYGYISLIKDSSATNTNTSDPSIMAAANNSKLPAPVVTPAEAEVMIDMQPVPQSEVTY